MQDSPILDNVVLNIMTAAVHVHFIIISVIVNVKRKIVLAYCIMEPDCSRIAKTRTATDDRARAKLMTIL